MDKNTIGKINAIVVYTAWFCFIPLAVSIIIMCFSFKLGMQSFIVSGAMLFLLAIAHLILAYYVRCPHCNKCLTAQGFAPPHKNSRVIGKTEAWVVVVKQWFSGSIICIHCGNEVNTNAL